MALVCDRIGFTYEGAAEAAFAGVSLTVEPGEVLGVAGSSGSGKTTLLRCMAGSLVPVKGTVSVDGMVLTDVPGRRRSFAARVALVRQLPEQQLFAKTILEEVSFGPRNLGLSEAEVSERACWALECVDIPIDRAIATSPFSCSGGERRRIAIAGMLAMRPDYLLLDEPTAGLDAVQRDRVLKVVAELADDGMGVAVVSHDVDVLCRCADTAALLADGALVATGTAGEVLGSPDVLARAGLSPSAPVALAARLRAAGMALPRGLLTDGDVAAAVAAACGAGSVSAGGADPAGAGGEVGADAPADGADAAPAAAAASKGGGAA